MTLFLNLLTPNEFTLKELTVYMVHVVADHGGCER